MSKLEKSIAALTDEERRGIVAFVREAEQTNQRAVALLGEMENTLGVLSDAIARVEPASR